MSLTALRIANLREVERDVWIGGQPSAEQLREAAAAGLKTVVNLCGSHECGWDEQQVCESLGLRYSHVPVTGACDLTRDSSQALHDALHDCPRPVLVHCGSGMRVGALFALKARHVDGAGPEEALELGRRAGLGGGLEAAVRALLAQD